MQGPTIQEREDSCSEKRGSIGSREDTMSGRPYCPSFRASITKKLLKKSSQMTSLQV